MTNEDGDGSLIHHNIGALSVLHVIMHVVFVNTFSFYFYVQ